MTNHPDLQQFARQLALWTELVIENGRTPFRRVDLYPQVQTEQGVLRPPLIFWINRQSMMAGGILLLPERDLSAELERGRCCAEALGLRNFVTWETDRVRIWQLDGAEIKQHQDLHFKDVANPDSFRHLLEELLEVLKLLAVIGLIPPGQLSAHYLHNLFQTALELSLPPLLNSYRSQRAQETEDAGEDAERQAVEANRQLLLQLLALLWFQQMPSAILPEKLARAIELSLPQLPEPLRQSLSWKISAEPTSMPHETTVCFHHLLLRLRQLSWDQSQQRALTALQLLFDSWFPPQPLESTAQNCFYPAVPRLAPTTRSLLSDSPSLLATVGLLEQLEKQPPRQQYFGNLLQFTPETLPKGTLQATLTNSRIPGRAEQQQYASLLRTSWPNRRFKLATATPLWQWEALHLLGLYRIAEPLALTLPAQALSLATDEPFWPLLLEHYQLCSVDSSNAAQLKLQLVRGATNEQPVQINTSETNYQLIPAEELQLRCSQLLQALQLPVRLYHLSAEQLVFCGEEQLTSTALRGLKLYADSLLGQRLWQLLTAAPQPATEEELFTQAKRIGWPHPEARILEELFRSSSSTEFTPEQLDGLLAELLGCADILQIERQGGTLKKRPLVEENLPGKLLRQQLIEQLQNEGLPTFPEKYLYFLDQPQMVTYRFAPPLQIRNELLGQFELVDVAGQIIHSDGEELVRVLLLCSQLGKNQVELPSDRQQLCLLLDQYCQDLRAFHQHLSELCFRRVENAKAARKLTKKTWSELALPPLKWLEAQP